MADSAQQIGFQQVGLGGILRGYRLAVPAHQREYSWTEEEVRTLLQDFAKAIAEPSEYFLGTVVTVPKSPDMLEIIDGQQRLATTAIFLAQVRNYLAKQEPLIAESINNGFLTDIDRHRRERVSKLTLNLDDNEYFRILITASEPNLMPRPLRQSHQLIWDAFRVATDQIKNIISGFDVKDHGDILNKWIWFVEHDAQVVLLKVPTEANAYKMFETLNDRGLRITQAHLVKSYLFGQAGDTRLAEAIQKWALIRGALESLEEDDITVTFLRHALIAIRGFLRQQEVYEAVQLQAKGAQMSIAFLNMLEGLANTYVAIFNPEAEKWNSYPDAMRRGIQTLNLLNIRPMRPLMLAVAAKFPPAEAAEVFRMLISCGVRLLIAASTRSGSMEERMAAAAHSVFTGKITDSKGVRPVLSSVAPTDEQFRVGFEIATVSKVSLGRYYLRSLEMTAKGEPSPWFVPNDDRQTITMEHVLPQNPGPEWAAFDAETATTYSKRIGNLVLLPAKSNAALGNTDFKAKSAVLGQAPYELTRQVAGVPDWTPEMIAQRQRILAGLALKTWPL
jgi:Protein of unknown function DUF262/Protein of unknown function (DUF1524)